MCQCAKNVPESISSNTGFICYEIFKNMKNLEENKKPPIPEQ